MLCGGNTSAFPHVDCVFGSGTTMCGSMFDFKWWFAVVVYMSVSHTGSFVPECFVSDL